MGRFLEFTGVSECRLRSILSVQCPEASSQEPNAPPLVAQSENFDGQLDVDPEQTLFLAERYA